MLSNKYDFKKAEQTWQKMWQDEQIYRFDPDSAKPIYSIDTPPPTVNGKIHIGHIFSYSQAEIIARYRRMFSILSVLMTMVCPLRDWLRRSTKSEHISCPVRSLLNFVCKLRLNLRNSFSSCLCRQVSALIGDFSIRPSALRLN